MFTKFRIVTEFKFKEWYEKIGNFSWGRRAYRNDGRLEICTVNERPYVIVI